MNYVRQTEIDDFSIGNGTLALPVDEFIDPPVCERRVRMDGQTILTGSNKTEALPVDELAGAFEPPRIGKLTYRTGVNIPAMGAAQMSDIRAFREGGQNTQQFQNWDGTEGLETWENPQSSMRCQSPSRITQELEVSRYWQQRFSMYTLSPFPKRDGTYFQSADEMRAAYEVICIGGRDMTVNETTGGHGLQRIVDVLTSGVKNVLDRVFGR